MTIPEIEFVGFGKIPRLNREIVVTEKIDGTNALVYVDETGNVFAGSRTRWITPANDNYGFAAWVEEHSDQLRELGPGRHFGEYWGAGVNRGYGLSWWTRAQDGRVSKIPERRFSLFNTGRWAAETPPPACCSVVPVLYAGPFSQNDIDLALIRLAEGGSVAAPGFMRPEGIVVYHVAAGSYFKVTLGNDGRKSAA